MKPLEDSGKSNTVNFRVGPSLHRDIKVAQALCGGAREAAIIRTALWEFVNKLRTEYPDHWYEAQERLAERESEES